MRIRIPARTGRGVSVREGQRFRVVQVEGKQVGDLFAFRLDDLGEFLSPAHTRSKLNQLRLEVGRPLYSNRRAPLLVPEEDTVGVHDLLSPPCDTYRYSVDYGLADHPNCRDNLRTALREAGLEPPCLPDPVNLFQNTPVLDLTGRRDSLESPARPGDYIRFRAEADLFVVVSACPQDQNPINGFAPSDLEIEVEG